MLMYVAGACLCRYLQFSGIAIAVAHEITHGFDDEGYAYACLFIVVETVTIHRGDSDVSSFVVFAAILWVKLL